MTRKTIIFLTIGEPSRNVHEIRKQFEQSHNNEHLSATQSSIGRTRCPVYEKGNQVK